MKGTIQPDHRTLVSEFSSLLGFKMDDVGEGVRDRTIQGQYKL